MKTRVIAVSAILAILMLGAVATTYAYTRAFPSGTPLNSSGTTGIPSDGSHSGDNGTQQNQQDQQDNHDGGDLGGHLNLTVGSSFTLANLTGHWVAFNSSSHWGNDSGDLKTGNATGAFTFKVTGTFSQGDVLTITSGKFSINGTSYTVSSGTLTLNAGDESGVGNGAASGGATFLIQVSGLHGNFTSGAQAGTVKLDVKVGTSEYLVILGSNEGVQEDDSSD